MACPSNSQPCAQPYPIRNYFLAFLITVLCLVCLRMLLFGSYYAWMRIAARRQFIANFRGNQSLPSASENPLSMSSSVSMIEPRVCVIVPGEDRPTFVAMPAPLAPSRDYSTPIVSVKIPWLP